MLTLNLQCTHPCSLHSSSILTPLQNLNIVHSHEPEQPSQRNTDQAISPAPQKKMHHLSNEQLDVTHTSGLGIYIGQGTEARCSTQRLCTVQKPYINDVSEKIGVRQVCSALPRMTAYRCAGICRMGHQALRPLCVCSSRLICHTSNDVCCSCQVAKTVCEVLCDTMFVGLHFHHKCLW